MRALRTLLLAPLLLSAPLAALAAQGDLSDFSVTYENGRWLVDYATAGSAGNTLVDAVVDADERRAYVLAQANAYSVTPRVALFALDAKDGTPLWETVERGAPRAMDLSRDGTRIAVVGATTTDGTAHAWIGTFRTDDGQHLWNRTLQMPSGSRVMLTSVVWGTDGGTLFVGGMDTGASTWNALVAALDASTGSTRWLQTQDFGRSDAVRAVVATPDGSAVLAVGRNDVDAHRNADTFVSRFDAVTGGRSWTTFRGDHFDSAYRPVARMGDDGVVYVGVGSPPIVTAQDASTGAERWRTGLSGANLRALTLSPDGARLFTTGAASSTAVSVRTSALDVASGGILWSGVSQYGGASNVADGIAVGPNGDVLVSGHRSGSDLPGGAFVAAIRAADGITRCTGFYDSPYADSSALVRSTGSEVLLAVGAGPRVHVLGYPTPHAEAEAAAVSVRIGDTEWTPSAIASAASDIDTPEDAAEAGLARVILPANLGEVLVPTATAETRTAYGCPDGRASSFASAEVARAHVAGIHVEGAAAEATADLWWAGAPDVRGASRLAQVGAPTGPFGVDTPRLRVVLPGGALVVEHNVVETNDEAGVTQVRATALRISTTLPDGTPVVIRLAEAAASATQGGRFS